MAGSLTPSRSDDDAERTAIEQIAASAPGGPTDAWYDAIEQLAIAASYRRPSYGQAMRGLYGTRAGLIDVERSAIVAEGSAVLRPKFLCARPAQPPVGAPPRKDRKVCNPPLGPNNVGNLPISGSEAVDVDPTPWEPRDRPGRWRTPRRLAWGLTEAVRPLGKPRQQRCCRELLAGAAGLAGHSHGRLAWTGYETCSSVWACPTCSWRIRAHRGVELSELVRVIRDTTPQTDTGEESRLGTGGAMATFTIRHAYGDDLKSLRQLLTRSWSRFIRGTPFARFKAATGLIGFVRAIEVTHGKRGWHPHLHAMIVGAPGWNKRRYARMSVETWMRRRWLACVRAEGATDGSEATHVPSWEHAMKLGPIRQGYLEKMGLELVLDRGKRAAHGNRTPWEIADDWRRCRRKRSARIWRGYAAGMKRCKFLTWSRALRRWVGLGASVKDSTIAADKGQPLGSLPSAAWVAIRDRVDPDTGRSITLQALEIGEREGVRRALQYCWRQAQPQMRREGKHGTERREVHRQRAATDGVRTRGHGTTTTTKANPKHGEVLPLRQADDAQGGRQTMGVREVPERDVPSTDFELAMLAAVCADARAAADRADGGHLDGMDGQPERDGATFAAAMLAEVFAERDRAAGNSVPELRRQDDAHRNGRPL
jgi:hypothetical protein